MWALTLGHSTSVVGEHVCKEVDYSVDWQWTLTVWVHVCDINADGCSRVRESIIKDEINNYIKTSLVVQSDISKFSWCAQNYDKYHVVWLIDNLHSLSFHVVFKTCMCCEL